MSKDKQIEEIANIIFAFTPLETMRYDVENAASALYHAGYRKQSEGEWLKYNMWHECSVCHIRKIYSHDFAYCPHCGAKMKGGTE